MSGAHAINTPVSTPLVAVEGLRKSFKQDGSALEVLKGIDLDLQSGEVATVVGPSGAGKSTLLHLLGTLDRPSAGAIRYDGVDVTRMSNPELAKFRNRQLGFVFQFHYLLPEFSALENVMMPGLISSEPGIEKRAEQLLDQVGLSARLQHRPSELSGGEQQRVALARALVMEPKLILADEPTGNLDSATSQAVHELMFELNRELGTTFLIVTHNSELAALSPRVLSMQDGKIVNDERHHAKEPDLQPQSTGTSKDSGGAT